MKAQETVITRAAWKTLDRWIAMVQEKNVAAVVSLYGKNGCAFWGTFADHIRQTQEEITSYFDVFLDCESISCHIINCFPREISETVVAFSGTYAFKIVKEKGDAEIEAPARFTFTLRYKVETQEWLLIEHHSSLIPENGY